jgi:hypothetical protein
MENKAGLFIGNKDMELTDEEYHLIIDNGALSLVLHVLNKHGEIETRKIIDELKEISLADKIFAKWKKKRKEK